MSGQVDITALIPHQGRMCLLGRVVSWDKVRIRCAADSHRAPGNPLRGATGLLAVCGIEYAAQAAGVHSGLLATAGRAVTAPKAGYLANVKEVTWTVDRLDQIEDELLIDAEMLISGNGRSIYEFVLTAQGRTLVQGRVAVALEGGGA
jgi:predicted hotdog family 3-hydroxylacyl-ACP dehydratase